MHGIFKWKGSLETKNRFKHKFPHFLSSYACLPYVIKILFEKSDYNIFIFQVHSIFITLFKFKIKTCSLQTSMWYFGCMWRKKNEPASKKLVLTTASEWFKPKFTAENGKSSYQSTQRLTWPFSTATRRLSNNFFNRR